MTMNYKLGTFSTLCLQRELNRRILIEASTEELRNELIRRETSLKPLICPTPRVPKNYVSTMRSEGEPSIETESTSLERSSQMLDLVFRHYGPSKPRTSRLGSRYSAAQTD